MHSFWWWFWLSHLGLGRCCSMSTHIFMMWSFLAIDVPKTECKWFLLLGSDISISPCSVLESGCAPFQDIYFPEGWYPSTPEKGIILFSFRFSQWHICITCFTVLSWSLQLASCPTNKVTSAILNTFGMSLKISLIFHCFFFSLVPGLTTQLASMSAPAIKWSYYLINVILLYGLFLKQVFVLDLSCLLICLPSFLFVICGVAAYVKQLQLWQSGIPNSAVPFPGTTKIHWYSMPLLIMMSLHFPSVVCTSYLCV